MLIQNTPDCCFNCTLQAGKTGAFIEPESSLSNFLLSSESASGARIVFRAMNVSLHGFGRSWLKNFIYKYFMKCTTSLDVGVPPTSFHATSPQLDPQSVSLNE